MLEQLSQITEILASRAANATSESKVCVIGHRYLKDRKPENTEHHEPEGDSSLFQRRESLAKLICGTCGALLALSLSPREVFFTQSEFQ